VHLSSTSTTYLWADILNYWNKEERCSVEARIRWSGEALTNITFRRSREGSGKKNPHVLTTMAWLRSREALIEARWPHSALISFFLFSSLSSDARKCFLSRRARRTEEEKISDMTGKVYSRSCSKRSDEYALGNSSNFESIGRRWMVERQLIPR